MEERLAEGRGRTVRVLLFGLASQVGSSHPTPAMHGIGWLAVVRLDVRLLLERWAGPGLLLC